MWKCFWLTNFNQGPGRITSFRNHPFFPRFCQADDIQTVELTNALRRRSLPLSNSTCTAAYSRRGVAWRRSMFHIIQSTEDVAKLSWLFSVVVQKRWDISKYDKIWSIFLWSLVNCLQFTTTSFSNDSMIYNYYITCLYPCAIISVHFRQEIMYNSWVVTIHNLCDRHRKYQSFHIWSVQAHNHSIHAVLHSLQAI